METMEFPFGCDAKLRKTRRRVKLVGRIKIVARHGKVHARGTLDDLMVLRMAHP